MDSLQHVCSQQSQPTSTVPSTSSCEIRTKFIHCKSVLVTFALLIFRHPLCHNGAAPPAVKQLQQLQAMPISEEQRVNAHSTLQQHFPPCSCAPNTGAAAAAAG